MASDAGVRGRQPMQHWELFPMYIPQKTWDSFVRRTDYNMVTALDLLLNVLLSMGLRTPSEQTQAMLVALLVIREGNDRRVELQGDSSQLRSLLCLLQRVIINMFFLAVVGICFRPSKQTPANG